MYIPHWAAVAVWILLNNMFTGIIEKIGQVGGLQRKGISADLQIYSPLVSQLKLGDSVSVNGVCLTVVSMDKLRFSVQLAAETIQRTNLGLLKPRDKVNLEPAVPAGGRLGGHIVQGHVDGSACIRRQQRLRDYALWYMSAPAALVKYIVPKGSVTLDGVSLTVVDVKSAQFSVSLIPHTLANTTLGGKKIGNKLNLEVDILGKYVERMLEGEGGVKCNVVDLREPSF